MRKIPLNKGIFTLVDSERYEALSKFKWYLHNGRYAIRHSGGRGGKMILMHREVLEAKKGQTTDHINGDSLDNRKVNLRFCSSAQNGWNRGKTSKNTSGFKGIYKDSRNRQKPWFIKLVIDQKPVYLGFYKTLKEASEEYKEKVFAIHGEFAYLKT